MEEEKMSNSHKCKNNNWDDFSHCAVCEGRIHENDCTTRKRKGIDCFGKHTPAERELVGYGTADQYK